MKRIEITTDDFTGEVSAILERKMGLDRYVITESGEPRAVLISSLYFDLLTESLDLLAKMVADPAEHEADEHP